MTAAASYLDAFGQYQRRRGLRSGTITTRRNRVRQLARWLGDPERVCTAKEPEVLDFLGGCSLSPRSRGAYLSSLHAFYRWAVREGLVTSDPTEAIDRPRLHRLLPRPVATEELELGLAYADPLLRCWLLAAAYAGLRCQEIAYLSREDVLDWVEDPVIRVSEEGAKGGNERMVPLHLDLLCALRTHGLPRAGYLFTRRGSSPYPPYEVSHKIAGHFHDLGSSATAHQLRHWFGSEIYRLTKDLRLVQELMGHASPQTTAGYAKLDWSSASIVRTLSVGPRQPG
jgi:integrase